MTVDLDMEQGADGTFDLVIANGDFKTSDGFESPILASLFSDRRAFEDEVGDPFRRRGWLHNDLLPSPDDNFGSGLWFYEQARLDENTRLGIRQEAEAALAWMVEERIVESVVADVVTSPEDRSTMLEITLRIPTQGESRIAYVLANNTVEGVLRDG